MNSQHKFAKTKQKLVTKSFLLKGFGFAVCALLSYRFLFWMWDEFKLKRLENSWNGFEQTVNTKRGCYNFTLVSGLFDIGRGKWWTQGRSYNEYLGHLLQILMLDVNLVIFIEPKGVDFVERMRFGRESRTMIVQTELSDLEYFPLLPKIREIMRSKDFQENNANFLRGLPEGTEPLYNLVTNSKTSLVHRAVSLDPFQSEYFVWMDAGYGHGDPEIFPPDGTWCPHHLLQHPDKVSFIAFESLDQGRMAEAQTLHKQKTAWLAGGLFAGGVQAMERFYTLHKETLLDYIMKKGVIDDDQTTFVDCVLKERHNFRPVLGDWYDLMKPSSSVSTV